MRIVSRLPAPENSVFGKLPVAMNSEAQVTLAGRVIGRVVRSGVVDEHTLEVEMEIDDEWATSIGLGVTGPFSMRRTEQQVKGEHDKA